MSRLKTKPQSFEYSAVILLVSTVLVKLIGAIFKIPLKNVIGTLGFGYFSSAYDLFLPIYSLSMAGLPVAVSKMVAENVAQKKYKEARKTLKVAQAAFLVTGAVGFTAMLLLTYPFVSLTTSTEADAWYVAICIFCIAPALLFCCIMSSYRGYFEGFRNMIPTAISDVIESLGKLIFGFGLAFVVLKITGNVAYAAGAALLGITLGTIAAMLYIRLRHRIYGDTLTEEDIENSPEAASSKVILKALIAIAVPVVLSSLASTVTLLIDTTMIKWQLTQVMSSSGEYIRNLYSSSIADYNLNALETLKDENIPTFLYGIRGEAFTIYNLIPTLTSALGIGAIPVLATAWIKKDMPEVKRNIDSIIRTTAIIALPAGLGASALSGFIMRLLYRDVASYEIGGVLLFILGIAAVFSGISVPITSMLQAIGKPKVPLVNIAVGALLKIITNFLLVGRPEFNIKGAPIGTAVCYFYIFVSNIVCLIKFTGVKPDFVSAILKPLISALCSSAGAFLCSKLVFERTGSDVITVAVSVILAVIIYFAMVFILKTLTKEDVEAFPAGKKIASVLTKLHLLSK